MRRQKREASLVWAPLWSTPGLAQGTRECSGRQTQNRVRMCVHSLPSEDSDFTFRLLGQLFLVGTCTRRLHLLVLGGRREGCLLTCCRRGLLLLPPCVPFLLLGQDSSGQGWRWNTPAAQSKLQPGCIRVATQARAIFIIEASQCRVSQWDTGHGLGQHGKATVSQCILRAPWLVEEL